MPYCRNDSYETKHNIMVVTAGSLELARLLQGSLFEGILSLSDVSVKTLGYWAGTNDR